MRGFIAQHTEFTIAEKRFTVVDGDACIRMKIIEPAEHTGCWISDKDHIVQSLAEDVEDARAVELQRRTLVRLARKQKAAASGSTAGSANSSSSRQSYIGGKMDVSAETSFLLNGNQRHAQVRIDKRYAIFTECRTCDVIYDVRLF